MRQVFQARLLRIYISENDRYKGKLLYQAIVDKCRELKIAGATVLRGLEGYGENAELHKAHMVRRDQPILVSIVDTQENLDRVVPVIEEMMHTGLMASSDVQVIRIQNKPPSDDGKAV